MDVIFVPYWGPGNPYQDELARCLELQGIKVDKGDTFKAVFNRIIFNDYRPDVIHLHWLPFFSLEVTSVIRLILFMIRLSIVRLLGFKIVWTVHNLVPHEAKNHGINHLAGKFVGTVVNRIIVHSESAREIIMSKWHLKCRDKIFVVPHGNYINWYANNIERITAREKMGMGDSRCVMLLFGGIRPYKGVLPLIEAFKMLSENGAKAELMIVGRPLNDEFSNTVKAAIGNFQDIQYKPEFVPDDEVQVYMNSCDVVVFPYHEILTSGAVVLAMSFGRACVAPRLGCIPDILDERGAFLYEPGDSDGLVGAMRKAVEQYPRLKQMGEYNRAKSLQMDWGTIGEKTKEIYQGSLSQKTVPQYC
jgi:beta-1,4-mannosyltransferase